MLWAYNSWDQIQVSRVVVIACISHKGPNPTFANCITIAASLPRADRSHVQKFTSYNLFRIFFGRRAPNKELCTLVEAWQSLVSEEAAILLSSSGLILLCVLWNRSLLM
jgi:hypothetical protein